jgi:hypothetical protein
MINKVPSFSPKKKLKKRKKCDLSQGEIAWRTRDVFEQIVHAQFLQPLHSNICSMETIPGVYMETG